MAYVNIVNGQIDAGSPATTALFTALRDNPLAVLEGDSTLPQFQAGGLLMLDSQELGADSGVIVFDPVDLGTFNYFQIIGTVAFQSGASIALNIQIRETAGTWRTLVSVLLDTGATEAKVVFATIANANNHGAFTSGSGNIVMGHAVASEGLGLYSKTNNAAEGVQFDTSLGYSAFNEPTDEIRILSSGSPFVAGSAFLLYGVKSGSIEGSAS